MEKRRFPLLRMVRAYKSIDSVLDKYGNYPCVLYSELKGGYYKDGEWVSRDDEPDAKPLVEWYQEFRDKLVLEPIFEMI